MWLEIKSACWIRFTFQEGMCQAVGSSVLEPSSWFLQSPHPQTPSHDLAWRTVTMSWTSGGPSWIQRESRSSLWGEPKIRFWSRDSLRPEDSHGSADWVMGWKILSDGKAPGGRRQWIWLCNLFAQQEPQMPYQVSFRMALHDRLMLVATEGGGGGKAVIYRFIPLVSKYLLSSYYVPDPFLGPRMLWPTG